MTLTFLHPLPEQQLIRMLASEGLFYVKSETGIEVREIPASVLLAEQKTASVTPIRKARKA